MKALEQFFPMMLFIMLYKMVLTFVYYFSLVLFIVLCKVVIAWDQAPQWGIGRKKSASEAS